MNSQQDLSRLEIVESTTPRFLILTIVSLAGESAEILCRYSIVCSFFDADWGDDYLERALAINPNHPRANYILAINRKETGNYEGAIEAYLMAIKNYPATDRFHLNPWYLSGYEGREIHSAC